MTNGQPTNLLKHVRKLVTAQTHRNLGDAELVDLFRAQHDETAFAALMERHGAMVLGVCRRVLGNHHDAEDACQATFLVFARKVGSIRKKGVLGSWLHGVAFRIASDLKKRIARRASVHDTDPKGRAKATDTEVSWREVQSILDEELALLPERYRLPVVLCCLEGRTRDEAAQQIGLSLGSLRGRLDRGREMLRARLVRRGVTLTAAMVGAILAGNGTAAALPPTLALATCTAAMAIISGKKVAAGILSAQVASLTEGIVKNMFMIRVKLAAMLLTTVLLVGGATGAFLCGADDGPLAASPPQNPNPPVEKAARSDKAPVSDHDRLQGKWVSIACEMNGNKVDVKGQDFRFNPSFDGNKYVVQFGPVHMKGKFEIDPKSNPKSITLNDADGTVNAGIYEFIGDQLRICIADSKNRPTAFKTKEGSGHSLILLKRMSRDGEVRDAVERFLSAALSGEAEKVRALAGPSISDEQLARFKGIAKKISLSNVQVTAGPAPTSHGDNKGRALVITDEIEVTEGRGKTKGRVVLTLLKDDVRVETKGWLIWDIDLRDQASVDKEVKTFADRYTKPAKSPHIELPKPKDAPANAKPVAKKVYTPDEVTREKYDPQATRTVEFKVVVVTKPSQIKGSPDKDSPWVIGHGPDDVTLLPYPPKKVDGVEFSVILTSKVVDQLKRIGITDVGKHFDGKTIRASGRVNQHRYIGDDPPEEPHYDLVIEDVSQIEAVKEASAK